MTSNDDATDNVMVTSGSSMMRRERKKSASRAVATGRVSECTNAASACTAMERSLRIVRSPPRKTWSTNARGKGKRVKERGRTYTRQCFSHVGRAFHTRHDAPRMQRAQQAEALLASPSCRWHLRRDRDAQSRRCLGR
eukprot:scaffold92088_cov31-Tisochrysis_lutea.AAC.6